MNITREFLSYLAGYDQASSYLIDVFGNSVLSWQEVVAHPQCSARLAVRIKESVAQHGSDEDRAILREDKHMFVRLAVACYGSNGDRAALRGDEVACVRAAVAKYSEKAEK